MGIEDWLKKKLQKKPNKIPEKEIRSEQRSQFMDRSAREYERLLGISLKDMEGKRVLDIGSGYGDTFSKEATEMGVEVFSMSPAFLNIGTAEPHVRSAFLKGRQGRSIAGRVQEMPFDDNTFDYELALLSVPMYLDPSPVEYKKFIDEVLRTLKSGGKAYIYSLYNNEVSLIKPILEELKEYVTYELPPIIAGQAVYRLILTKK